MKYNEALEKVEGVLGINAPKFAEYINNVTLYPPSEKQKEEFIKYRRLLALKILEVLEIK